MVRVYLQAGVRYMVLSPLEYQEDHEVASSCMRSHALLHIHLTTSSIRLMLTSLLREQHAPLTMKCQLVTSETKIRISNTIENSSAARCVD